MNESGERIVPSPKDVTTQDNPTFNEKALKETTARIKARYEKAGVQMVSQNALEMHAKDVTTLEAQNRKLLDEINRLQSANQPEPAESEISPSSELDINSLINYGHTMFDALAQSENGERFLNRKNVWKDAHRQIDQQVRTGKLTASQAAEIRAELDVIREAAQRIEPLTHLLTNDTFTEELKIAVDHAKNTQEDFVVTFIDLNNFKQINDLYGHPAGDAILQKWADFARRKLQTAWIGRKGGDEFFAFYQNRNREDVEKIMQEAKEGLFTEMSEINHKYGIQKPVTMSVGYATLEQDDTASSLIDRADKEMYREKYEFHAHDDTPPRT